MVDRSDMYSYSFNQDEDRYGEGVGDEAGDQVLRKQHKQQSQNVLKELKSVLVVKEQEFQVGYYYFFVQCIIDSFPKIVR